MANEDLIYRITRAVYDRLGPGTDEHLGLALSDALIGRLTAFEELRVRPTAVVAAFAGVARSPREIAQELGRSEGAVKQLQFRALETLREQVRKSDE